MILALSPWPRGKREKVRREQWPYNTHSLIPLSRRDFYHHLQLRKPSSKRLCDLSEVTQLPSVVDSRFNLESNREPLWASFQAGAGHGEVGRGEVGYRRQGIQIACVG